MEEVVTREVVVREPRISKSDGRRKTIETTNLTRVKKTPSKPNKHDDHDSVKRSKSTIKYNSATMKEITSYSSIKTTANNGNRLSNLLSSPRSPRALSARDAEVLVRQAVSDATKGRTGEGGGGDTPGKLCRSSSGVPALDWTKPSHISITGF